MNRLHSFFPMLLVGILLAFVACPMAARNKACKKELEESKKLYRAGRLAAAAGPIQSCLEAGLRPTKRVQIKSHELLANIYLARDEGDAVAAEIRQLLRLDPDFKPALNAAPRFQNLVTRTRNESSAERVSSVSKITENPRQAPATVEVITGEVIEQRGYLDLEALLHDLPGFDISRTNGSTYANIYQRGYRSPTTDRTLFLVDGVEHNDLTSNVAFLSRQYPLSNVERVEVIYGPASTLYGANAFAGVINVISKDPAAYLGQGKDGKPRNIGVHASLGAGSWNTRYLDATVAGSTPDGGLQFSLTGRLYKSNEPDLSGFELGYWDYNPQDFDSVDYTRLGFTPEQAERARELDRAVFTGEYQDADVSFSDVTDDWYIGAKVKLSHLEFGLQSWRRYEGSTPWYTDAQRPGANNGSVWVPEQTALYIRYDRPLTDNLSLFLFSRYKVHSTSPDSSSFSLVSYANGGLKPEDLTANRPAFWKETILVRSSNQLRNEVGLVYEPSTRFNLVAGVELRNGSIQGDYARAEGQGEEPDPSTDGGEHFDVRDLGVYIQASFKLLAQENLKLVAGGRFDQNQIRPTGGYGDAFNPRLGIVYSPGAFNLKAIYSEAFKDASSFNKFATSSSREVNNPDLGAEKVENLEISASWRGQHLEVGVAAYDAIYSNVVGLRSVADPDDASQTTGQFQNLGEIKIRGLQANLAWKPGKRVDLYANYTYTDPRNSEPLDNKGNPRTDVDTLRIGDIASHQINVGVHGRLLEKLDVDLRVNYVGDRKTGEQTTVATNPFDKIDAYTVAHATVTYKNLVRGLDLQVLVQNLLDESYTHPGIREAGERFAALAPQPGRSVFVRAIYRF